ncbi:MAG TPA: hypothetical protein VFF13_04805 [archaeon]|nr:hypothetical protein [archaeon]
MRKGSSFPRLIKPKRPRLTQAEARVRLDVHLKDLNAAILPNNQNVLNYSSVLTCYGFARKINDGRDLLVKRLKELESKGFESCGLEAYNKKILSFSLPLRNVINAVENNADITMHSEKKSN